ncbi:MAG: prolyl oligopeptidase family serine peptidase [Bacteroidota bacterium]
MGQGLDAFKKELYISKSDTLPYRILYPKNYDHGKKYPLLLFLHGSGERGDDNELQLVHGASLFLKEAVREEFPAIVVFPQCQSNLSWNNARVEFINYSRVYRFPATVEPNGQLDLAEGLLAYLKSELPVDLNRMYLGGLSMGGMGTFELLHRNPNTFAAAFAICGGANPEIANRIKNTPLWIFHGDTDNVVPYTNSTLIYEALKTQQADVKITIYPEIGHDSWTPAFAEPELLPWLFSKERKD